MIMSAWFQTLTNLGMILHSSTTHMEPNILAGALNDTNFVTFYAGLKLQLLKSF